MRLLVDLGRVRVGVLDRAREGATFTLDPHYLDTPRRPVLGQAFEDDQQPRRTRARVPAWFSNLLPEGPLRELLARRAGVHPDRELFLLRHLGRDLPGAVTVVGSGDELDAEEDDAEPHATSSPADNAAPLKFSLAGVQLKFSVTRGERGLTVPVAGQGGEWIAKLPDPRFDDVPRNEHATMRWAAAAGVVVPRVDLAPTADIAGLPSELRTDEEALLVERFDRSAGRRIHQEDFAQVLEVYPWDKYKAANFETVVSLVRVVVGEADALQAVRRVAFFVLAGNGDGHLKNWSFVYPDGVRARLSPAYDILPTVLYAGDDDLGLNLDGSKRFERVTLDSFRSLAARVGVSEERVAETVVDAVTATTSALHDHGGDLGFSTTHRRVLSDRLASLPLSSA